MKLSKNFLVFLSILSVAITVFAANDPTRPSSAMVDQLKNRALNDRALKLQALVKGASGEGVALLGADNQTPQMVRAGTTLQTQIDGIQVPLVVKTVTEKGVELENLTGGKPQFLSCTYQALNAPTNVPPHFVSYLESSAVPLDALLRLVADQTGVNITVSDAASKDTKVTLFLRNVTAEIVVEEICRSTGLWFRQEDPSAPLRVMTMNEYTENISSFREEKTEIFTLLYPNVIEVASAIYGLYPERTLLSLGEEEFEEDTENDLSRRFRRFRVLEDNGGSQFLDMEPPDTSSSSGNGFGSGIFSFSRGSGISRLSQFDQLNPRYRRRGINLKPSQSDVKKLETVRSQGLTNQVEQLQGEVTSAHPNIFVSISRKNNILIVRTSDTAVLDEIRLLIKKIDVPTPMVLMEVKVLELTIDDDFEAGVKWTLTDVERKNGAATHLLGHDGDGLKNLLAETGTGTQNPITPTFAFLVVSDHVKAQIELMQKDGKVRTLATPTLLTANNEVSRIFSGKEYPLVTGWTQADTVTTDGVTVQGEPTVEIEKKDVGTLLLITPNINADKTVTLRLLQENSVVSDEKVSIPVSGGEGEPKEIEYVESRSLTGTFVAQDGNIVLAGGLIQEHQEETYWRTPVLGSIPWLGWLFRGTEKVKQRTELIVLIRPYVISTPIEGGKISRELLEKLSAHPARDGRVNMGVYKK